MRHADDMKHFGVFCLFYSRLICHLACKLYLPNFHEDKHMLRYVPVRVHDDGTTSKESTKKVPALNTVVNSAYLNMENIQH